MKIQSELNHYNHLYADSDYPTETAAACLLQDHYFKTIKNSAVKYQQADVLSIGSGTGYYEIKLAPMVKSVTCIELSETAVSKARNKADGLGLSNIHFIQGNGLTFHEFLPDKKFDMVLVLGFLHHISDREMEKIFSDVYTQLNPHGTVISMDPNHFRALGLLKCFIKPLIQKYHSSEERELKPHQIKKRFEKFHYNSVRIAYADYFLNPLVWVFPKISPRLIQWLLPMDRFLTSIPIIRFFSNLFVCVARK